MFLDVTRDSPKLSGAEGLGAHQSTLGFCFEVIYDELFAWS